MKPGLAQGQSAQITFTVTPDMFAAFEGRVVHSLLSTSSLVHQMEWAARQTILPYLEPHEEGMGARVEVRHLMPSPLGVDVTVKATVTDVQNNKVECDIDAWHFRGKVARGTVVQAIVERDWLASKVSELEIAKKTITEQSHA